MNALFGEHPGGGLKIRCPCTQRAITGRLCKLVSVLRDEPCHRHGHQIKNDVSKSIVLEMITLNTGENDGGHPSLLRIRNAGSDVQLDLSTVAIDLVTRDIVIME